MERPDISTFKNASTISQEISELIEDIENNFSLNEKKAKECKALIALKEKCCSSHLITSVSAFRGVYALVKRGVLNASQTLSTLVSLLPSVIHYNSLISTVGEILLFDMKEQLIRSNIIECSFYSGELQHPFVMILKNKGNKSWCEIYSFIYNLMHNHNDIKLEHKITVLRPIIYHVFINSEWKGSLFQFKLFNFLMQLKSTELLVALLEVVIWQSVDIEFCLLLQDIFVYLLNNLNCVNKSILSALTPLLAEAVKWITLSGCDPTSWISLLKSSIEIEDAALSCVLFLLTDVLLNTPSCYIHSIIEICKSIICSATCNKYVANRFAAISLNWLINPGALRHEHTSYKKLEEIIIFLQDNSNEWNDRTSKLINNKYFKSFGVNNINVKFAVDCILVSNSWCEKDLSLVNWLLNLIESDERATQFKLYSLIYSIILSENNKVVIDYSLQILFKVMDHFKEISFSFLCLLFYKLSKESDPSMQKTYLLQIPKLAVKKENIPLIISIIESLKRGSHIIVTPLVIQLYLTLWKLDNRTYSYLHKMLHETYFEKFNLELNLSKAIAIKEICKRAPFLHGKNVVSVLSKILNDCADHTNGLPSAISIEAVIELCKAYVIDISGTWDAIQPKLSIDKRSRVIIALCQFFGEIPSLKSSEKACDSLIKKIIPMLWNYTFFDDLQVVKHAFQALSKFEIENLELKLMPDFYKTDINFSKLLHKKSVENFNPAEEILTMTYVPAECWLEFLKKTDITVLAEGATLLIAIVQRELETLPRGVFYCPPEKSEPLSYSYLTPKSVCRVLVSNLQDHAKQKSTTPPPYVKEIIHIISQEYSKNLPPLNWEFMSYYLTLNLEYSRHSLALLLRQSLTSSSAKSILENYFSLTDWNDDKLEYLPSIYCKSHYLCKAISYKTFQSFYQKTLKLSLQNDLKNGTHHFKKALEILTEVFSNKNINSGDKETLAKPLENILDLIPPEHEIMKSYALCAVQFPQKAIENITSANFKIELQHEWLHKIIIIRSEIAMKTDIDNPLMLINQLIDAVGLFPREKNFLTERILFVIRVKRSSNHKQWLQELTWRIQASITNSEPKEVSLFLIDVFVCSVIVLSGYDCFFDSIKEMATDLRKYDVFPHSLNKLLNFPNWNNMSLKISQWIQKLLKWKDLPKTYITAFALSVLTLNDIDDSFFVHLLNHVLKNKK